MRITESQLRKLIREELEANKETDGDLQLFRNLLDYVASNKVFPIDSQQFSPSVSKRLMDFETLYRYWYDLPPNANLEGLTADLKSRPFFSATESLDDVVERLLPDHIGDRGVVVAEFSGKGLRPLSFIRGFLSRRRNELTSEETALAERVINDYGGEQEVIVTSITSEMTETMEEP